MRNVFAPYGDNYPAMTASQWANAPFNQPEPLYGEVDVCITGVTADNDEYMEEVTLDVEGWYNEDMKFEYDYSDLKIAVMEYAENNCIEKADFEILT